MKLIEYIDGKKLNAEVWTRNKKRIANLTQYNNFLVGNVEGTLHLWSEITGRHATTREFDLMVKVEAEPEFVYQVKLNNFLSSEYSSLEDLYHYISAEINSKGTIIKTEKI